jgi:hypothetical protein
MSDRRHSKERAMSLEHAPQNAIKKGGRRPRRDRFEPLLVPVLDGFDMVGVGVTKGYELVNAGLIQTVKVGSRRMAIVASLKALATGKVEQSADEKQKAS